MAQYIESEAVNKLLQKEIERTWHRVWGSVIWELYHKISQIPTADVVEVVHGEWKEIDNIVIENGMLTVKGTTWCCNVCGEARKTLTKPNMNFCPNCGAKMDGKDIDVTTKTDRVEVVRCGQCRHATEDIIVEGVCYCHKIQQGMFVDGFCSYGERRSGNERHFMVDSYKY